LSILLLLVLLDCHPCIFLLNSEALIFYNTPASRFPLEANIIDYTAECFGDLSSVTFFNTSAGVSVYFGGMISYRLFSFLSMVSSQTMIGDIFSSFVLFF
jgi:hypothetical protein